MGRVPLRSVTVFATLGLAALAVGIIAVRLAASDSSSPNALRSSRLSTVARELSRIDGIHLRSLPAGMTLKVSRSTAEATALREFEKPLTSNVSAFAAWGGTTGYRIKNRPVWVVVIPDQSVRGNPGAGQSAGPVFNETLVVFVDAKTGNYLRASTV
jgi:hypothetical protein